MRWDRRRLLFALGAAALGGCSRRHGPSALRGAAAADLEPAFRELTAQFSARTGRQVLLTEPLNALRVSLHPSGVAPRIENLTQWRAHALSRGAREVEVSAELYKLLVYEKGGFFLSHRDTEKAPGMFATLVISLPSSHEGLTTGGGPSCWMMTSD